MCASCHVLDNTSRINLHAFFLGLPYRNAAELILPRGRPEYSVDRSSTGLSSQAVGSMHIFLPKRKKPSHHSRDQNDHNGKLLGGLSSRSYDHACLSFSVHYSNSLKYLSLLTIDHNNHSIIVI